MMYIRKNYIIYENLYKGNSKYQHVFLMENAIREFQNR